MKLDVFVIAELSSEIFESDEKYIEYSFLIKEIAAKYNIGTNFGANMFGLHKNYTYKFKSFFVHPLYFEIVDNPLVRVVDNLFDFSNKELFSKNMGRLQLFMIDVLKITKKVTLLINSYEQKKIDKIQPLLIDANKLKEVVIRLYEESKTQHLVARLEIKKGLK